MDVISLKLTGTRVNGYVVKSRYKTAAHLNKHMILEQNVKYNGLIMFEMLSFVTVNLFG
jgi:hypothetical protein